MTVKKSELLLEENESDNSPKIAPDINEQLAFFRKMHLMREAIAQVQLEVDGYNEHQKYEYSKAKQYKALLNKVCLEVGMEFYPVLESVETILLPNDTSKQHLTRIRGRLVMIDLDTGFSIAFPTFADGCDSLDKGLYKAETMMIKSFVQMTFLRHDKDDIEPESTPAKPKGFIPTLKRKEIANNIISAEGEPASEEIIDRIYDFVMTIRGADPDFMTDGELDKFNSGTITQVEATALLYEIESGAEERGIKL